MNSESYSNEKIILEDEIDWYPYKVYRYILPVYQRRFLILTPACGCLYNQVVGQEKCESSRSYIFFIQGDSSCFRDPTSRVVQCLWYYWYHKEKPGKLERKHADENGNGYEKFNRKNLLSMNERDMTKYFFTKEEILDAIGKEMFFLLMKNESFSNADKLLGNLFRTNERKFINHIMVGEMNTLLIENYDVFRNSYIFYFKHYGYVTIEDERCIEHLPIVFLSLHLSLGMDEGREMFGIMKKCRNISRISGPVKYIENVGVFPLHNIFFRIINKKKISESKLVVYTSYSFNGKKQNRNNDIVKTYIMKVFFRDIW